MKTRLWMLVVGTVLALVGLPAPATLAQGPAGSRGPGGQGSCCGMGSMGSSTSLVAVAAEKLDITVQELITQLQDSATIAQVAESKGVALDTVVDAFLAPRTERLAEQVATGRLTQTQADTMLEMMRTNVIARLTQPWAPQGNGMGMGFVDANGDGVCDHAGAGRMMRGQRGRG